MECLPFNISVVLVSSGVAKTNILRNNQAASVPATTLYVDFADVIREDFDGSRMDVGTPLDQYARALVAKTFRSPPRYTTVGFGATLVAVLRTLLPRGFLLRLLWNQQVVKRQAALAKAK